MAANERDPTNEIVDTTNAAEGGGVQEAQHIYRTTWPTPSASYDFENPPLPGDNQGDLVTIKQCFTSTQISLYTVAESDESVGPDARPETITFKLFNRTDSRFANIGKFKVDTVEILGVAGEAASIFMGELWTTGTGESRIGTDGCVKNSMSGDVLLKFLGPQTAVNHSLVAAGKIDNSSIAYAGMKLPPYPPSFRYKSDPTRVFLTVPLTQPMTGEGEARMAHPVAWYAEMHMDDVNSTIQQEPPKIHYVSSEAGRLPHDVKSAMIRVEQALYDSYATEIKKEILQAARTIPADGGLELRCKCVPGLSDIPTYGSVAPLKPHKLQLDVRLTITPYSATVGQCVWTGFRKDFN